MQRNRLDPKIRKQSILTAAVSLSKRHGYANIRRDQVAEVAGVSPALVSKYFATMEDLRRTVMIEAVRLEVAPIVAQGLVAGCSIAKGAPEKLRKEAIETLGTWG